MSLATTADFLVIGAGAAGASAGYELAALGAVVVLEQEERPGVHATGRSAALFSETYGNAAVRALTRASRSFLTDAPDGFSETALLRPRGALFIAGEAELEALEALAAAERATGAFVGLSGEEVRARVPILRSEASTAGLYEAGAMDIDVDALHQGYLRGLRRRGGRVVVNAGVARLRRERGVWVAETGAGDFAAPIVINAAGAWADKVAGLARLGAIGLSPKRRTVAVVDGPDAAFADWPLVIEAGERFYFKPEAGRLLISPADETASEPCDAQPEDLDVAIAADRIETATTLTIRRISHRWAGLRTFAPDRTPVCGFDPRTEGFFWLAGQGGYGIQTSPALAQLTAHLIARSSGDPDPISAELSPDRLLKGSPPLASTAP
ncbi:MAG TPA: FAD-binding oxidoreductase [Caulobacteraceae bacterium]|nr:FAD-binding oxidoreductase [Caulobacteraceae bacterium]